jgi:hypothetical protein
MVEDTDELVAYNADVLRDPDMEDPDEGVAVWTRDLMADDHPTVNAADFTIVEDRCRGAIVSSLCLISQTWSYGGIEFGIGQPELVGTHPDYRRRGLVRAQIEEVHRWSAERAERMQVIAGIPWFYRQFGYEMGLTLGGGRVGYKPQVPKLKGDQAEPYRMRPAVESDLPFIAQAYEAGAERSLVACVRDEGQWQYELGGRSERNYFWRELRIVETPEGESVGFLAHPPVLWRGRAAVTAYELVPGISWLAVTPTVVRYLWATGEEYAAQDDKQEMGAFAFLLGAEHPVYQVLHDRLPQTNRSYAWYVRVPDLAGFVRHVAPVLERRLARSVLAGHNGDLKISFYRDGLRLVLERGRLTGAEPWQPPHGEAGAAGFPDLVFLQLLLGYRSLGELRHAFADCWAEDGEVRVLLEILFPKRPSNVWAAA